MIPPRLSQASRHRIIFAGSLLIFCVWVTHLTAIDTFPPFIDEMVHIHGSEQGFAQSPLANANLGRQFTIWWMMLFQAHQGNPFWVGRVATLLAILPGVAALMGIARLAVSSTWGVGLAGMAYLFSAYHFFFGRLGLADPIAGSATLVTIYLAYRLSRRVRLQEAVLTGIFLTIAVGAKISALPYLGIPLAAVLTLKPARRPWRKQIQWMAAALLTAMILIGGYIGGLRFFGHDVFSNSVSYALTNRGNVAASTLFDLERIARNVQFTFALWSSYLGTPVVVLSLLTLLVLIIRRRFYIPLCFIAPSAVIWINQIQESRFLFVPAALLLLAGAWILAEFLKQQKAIIQIIGLGLVLSWGAFQWLPFIVTAARDPADIPLPQADRSQYIYSDASGFGLEVVRDELRAREPMLVIGILSNCQALRYLARNDFPVECPNLNPSGEAVEALTQMMTEKKTAGTYAVLEALSFVPPSAPGDKLFVVERPGGGVSLTIYDLGSDS